MKYVIHYILNNYLLIFMLLGLAMLLNSHSKVERASLKYVWLIIFATAFLSVCEYLEILTAGLNHLVVLRTFLSIVCYVLRPLIALFFLFVIADDFKYRKHLWIPEMVNTVIMSMAFFTPLVFSYTDTGAFVRGPLGYTAFIVPFFYIALVLFFAFVKFDNDANEGMILILCAAACVISAIIEALQGGSYVTNTIFVSCIFYYVYLRSHSMSRDPLTTIKNRICFYEDCDNKDADISAIADMDLNELKTINDKLGHAAGDKAIIAVGKICKKHSQKNIQAYRIGGDEFVVLLQGGDYEKREKLLNQLHEKIIEACKIETVEDGRASFSVGLGVYNPEEDKEVADVVKKADIAMYEVKRSKNAGR